MIINAITQTDITRLDWQISRRGFGTIAQGVGDIAECILNIVSTQKGSQSFAPEFGCDLFQFIDQPFTVAGPGMAVAIERDVLAWEPRIIVLYVRWKPQAKNGNYPDGIRFEIGWQLKGGTISGQTDILLGTGEQIAEQAVSGGVVFYLLADENDRIITGDDLQIAIQI